MLWVPILVFRGRCHLGLRNRGLTLGRRSRASVLIHGLAKSDLRDAHVHLLTPLRARLSLASRFGKERRRSGNSRVQMIKDPLPKKVAESQESSRPTLR